MRPREHLRTFWARHRVKVLVYLALLVASHTVILIWNPDWYGLREPTGVPEVPVTVYTSSGMNGWDSRALKFDPPVLSTSRWPVILVHGSPSRGGADFVELGKALARDGRRVLAVDLFGYGNTPPIPADWVDYSMMVSQARLVEYAASCAWDDLRDAGKLAPTDHLPVHLVGWSLGCVPATQFAHNATDMGSLTLLGATVSQEGEGSGSYELEHLKYAVNWLACVPLMELVPHFNLAGDRAFREGYALDFWRTDQRGLAEALPRTVVQGVHVVHGVHDPLVPAWVAGHHARLASARLTLLDASHFFPLGPDADRPGAFDLAVREMNDFFAQCERGPQLVATTNNFSSVTDLSRPLFGGEIRQGYKPPGVVFAAVVAGLATWEPLFLPALSLLASNNYFDFSLLFLGGWFARLVRQRRRFRWRSVWTLPLQHALFGVTGSLLWRATEPLLGRSGAFVLAALVLTAGWLGWRRWRGGRTGAGMIPLAPGAAAGTAARP